MYSKCDQLHSVSDTSLFFSTKWVNDTDINTQFYVSYSLGFCMPSDTKHQLSNDYTQRQIFQMMSLHTTSSSAERNWHSITLKYMTDLNILHSTISIQHSQSMVLYGTEPYWTHTSCSCSLSTLHYPFNKPYRQWHKHESHTVIHARR